MNKLLNLITLFLLAFTTVSYAGNLKRGTRMEKDTVEIVLSGYPVERVKSLLTPFRLPMPSANSTIIYIDLDGDHFPDILRVTLSDGIHVQWIDDNADMEIGDWEGDMVDDCLMVDRNGDGLYGSYGDLIVDWSDLDNDGKADVQVVVDNIDESRKAISGGGHYMIVMDTDYDNVFNYINWDTYSLESWYHYGLADFYTDYHGNSVFLKIHSTPERLNDVRLSWENPFLFYDPDNDGLTEMTVRLCDSRYKKIMREDGRSFLSGESDWMALSLDLDNDNTPENPFDLDMTVNFQGSGADYKKYVKTYDKLRGLPEADSQFLDPGWRQNCTLIFPDRDEVLDFMYNHAQWDAVWFVFDEDGDCKRWERVELYQPLDIYAVGAGNGGLDDNRQADVVGDRGEWDNDNSGHGNLYMSPLDGKIHLYGAERGVWRIDQSARFYQGMGGLYDCYGPERFQDLPDNFPVIVYEDNDNDGFFDTFKCDMDGDKRFEKTFCCLDYGISDNADIVDISEMRYADFRKLFKKSSEFQWRRASVLMREAEHLGLNVNWYSFISHPKTIWQQYDSGCWLQFYLLHDLIEFCRMQGLRNPEVEILNAFFRDQIEKYIKFNTKTNR